jgi:dTDP-4-amino-4,6-dideoxygalactose transaminase
LTALYRQNLAELAEQGHITSCKDEAESNEHLFFIKAHTMQRTELIQALSDHNVDARFHYLPLHSSLAGQRFGNMPKDKFTTIESEKLLRLPLFYDLSIGQVEAVCNALKRIFA